MKFSRSVCINLLVSWLFIYFTGKLLFDTVPYIFELFSIGLFAWCAFLLVYSRTAADLHTVTLFITFLVFSGYVLLNGILQDDFSQLARAIYEYIFYILIFFAMLWLLPQANLKKCLKIFAFWGLLIACLSWVEFFTKTLLIADPVENYLEFRAIVFSRSFLTHGAVLGFFSLACMDICYRERKPLWFVAGLFCYISILTTASRGPFVACGIGLILQFMLNAYISRRHSWKRFAASMLFLFAIIAVCVLMFGTFLTGNELIDNALLRIRSIFNWTGEAGNAGRLLLWENALNWWRSSPLIGIGPSQTGSWGDGSIGVTESGVLKRLAELGVVGFVIFYFFIVCILIRAIRTYKRQDDSGKRHMTLWFSLATAVLINDCILQVTEEIVISFFLYTALAGLEMFRCNVSSKEGTLSPAD